MSTILGAVLDGIAQGLGIQSSDVEALTKLLHPDEFESRKEESVALEAAIGYDPEKYWNRKDMMAYLADMCGESVDDNSDYSFSDSIVDKALENFEKYRESFFDFAFTEAKDPEAGVRLSNKNYHELEGSGTSIISPKVDKMLTDMMKPGDSFTVQRDEIEGMDENQIFEFLQDQILNNRAEKALADDIEEEEEYDTYDEDEEERSLREEAQEIDEAEYSDDVEYPEEIDDLDEEDE